MKYSAAIRRLASYAIRFLRISFLELKAKNQSTLGVFWIPLTSLLFAAVLFVLFGFSTEGVELNFFFYVLVGYSFWQFVAASLNGSIELLRTQFDHAVHNGLNLTGLYLKALSDRVAELILNLGVCVLAALLVHPIAFGKTAILIMPAIALALITSLSVSYIISLIATLVPDLGRVIRTGTRFLFFVSPIFWTVGDTDQAIRRAMYSFNPVSYYLEVMRQAFGVAPFDQLSWLMAFGLTAAFAAMGWLLFVRTRSIVTNIK